MAQMQPLWPLGEAVTQTFLSAIICNLPHFGQAISARNSSSTADCKRIELPFKFPPTNSYKIFAQHSRDAHFFLLCQH